MSQSDTKQRLMNSAIKIFSKNGYFNTKVSDIVKDANVAQGTFYIYFKSKEEIFYQIVEFVVSQIEVILNNYQDKNIPPKEKILGFATESFLLINQYKEIAYIYFYQLLCVDEKFKQIYMQTDKKIEQFYLKTLKDVKDKHLITNLLLGFAKRLLEIEFLIKNKPIEEVINQFKKGVEKIFEGLER